MDYFLHLAILICLYFILAQSLNLNFGLGKLFNLAHISIYAIGAYTTALLSVNLGWDFWPCLISSVALCSLTSLLLGTISLKLADEYFAIGTLAFSFLVTALLINWQSLTRGVLGILGIPRPTIFGFETSSNLNFLILISIFALLSLLFLWLVFRSSYARSLRAQSENEGAALALAQNTTSQKVISFIIASAFAGLAGSLFAYYLNYIDPSSFNFSEVTFVLTIVVLGGLGSFWGCILATIFLVLLPEPLRLFDFPSSVLGPLRQILYALLLFIVLFWQRGKIFPPSRQI